MGEPLPDISAWQVAQLRLTAFLQDSVGPSDLKKWEDIVGKMPDSTHLDRKRNLMVEQGDLDYASLVSQVTPSRQDLVLSKREEEPEETASFGVFGHFPDMSSKFEGLATDWLEGAGMILRLAFGAVLYQNVENLNEGYGLLDRYLPEVKVAADS
jgi:hypothetical protein